MRRNTHTHKCLFAPQGCMGVIVCDDRNLERNHDPEGYICTVTQWGEIECEDCNLSRCSECGHIRNIEQCDNACPKATAI